MPHTFNPHPDHPAVAYLVRLHADLGGRIQQNKAEAVKLATDMLHVEAVLKMFDPEFNCRAISARRKQSTNPWWRLRHNTAATHLSRCRDQSNKRQGRGRQPSVQSRFNLRQSAPARARRDAPPPTGEPVNSGDRFESACVRGARGAWQ
jgi:hypothetical protein